MKYLLVLSLALVLGSVAVADEVYVPDNQPTQGNTNVIPFDANFMKIDCRYQALYSAKLLGGQPFTIKKMSFAPANTGNLKTTQMQVRISHFTGTALNATMDLNIPSPVTVLDAPHTYTYTQWCPGF